MSHTLQTFCTPRKLPLLLQLVHLCLEPTFFCNSTRISTGLRLASFSERICSSWLSSSVTFPKTTQSRKSVSPSFDVASTRSSRACCYLSASCSASSLRAAFKSRTSQHAVPQAPPQYRPSSLTKKMAGRVFISSRKSTLCRPAESNSHSAQVLCVTNPDHARM